MTQQATNNIKKYHESSARPKAKTWEEKEPLILEYAPMVKNIAGRIKMRLPPQVSQDDLVSAGVIGLLDAIEKFDKDRGVEFKSYAEFRIRGAMLDELRSMDWVPRSVRRNGKRIQEAYLKLEREKNRPADDSEVAEELGVDLETFYRMLDQVKGISMISEDEMGNIAPQKDLSQFLTMNLSRSETDPMDSLNLSEIRATIAKAIDRLPKNERTVIALYYYEELTMKEIGNVMGYTESRVSQLHTKAVLRLRNSLRTYFDV